MRSSYKNENILLSNVGIELDRALAFAPTLAAVDPHRSRSDRYTMVPTFPILQGLFTEGFQLHSISKATVRKEDKKGFEKHMLRLRQRDAVTKVGGTVNEIIIVNSHDGSTCFDMRGGMFRFVCSNGMVVGDDIARVKIKHHGDIINNVIEGAYEVMNTFERITESRERMMAIDLHRDEREAFAAAAMPIRFADPDEAGIRPTQLLSPHRQEDVKTDLWTVFNVVQENCIKGGLSGRKLGSNGRMRGTSMKTVNGIDQNMRVNQGLHILASRMADLKEGKPMALAA